MLRRIIAQLRFAQHVAIATTTYAYDAFGQRVLQTGTTTTYLYPFKWYSVASSTGSGAKFATSTDYVFHGDSWSQTNIQRAGTSLGHQQPPTFVPGGDRCSPESGRQGGRLCSAPPLAWCSGGGSATIVDGSSAGVTFGDPNEARNRRRQVQRSAAESRASRFHRPDSATFT
jgi:hypothetical protein